MTTPFLAFQSAPAAVGNGQRRASDGGGNPGTPGGGARPTTLPVLTSAGVKVRGWWDITDEATSTVNGSGDLTSVANKVVAPDALGTLWAPVKGPRVVPASQGALRAANFNVTDRLRKMQVDGVGYGTTRSYTAVVLFTRNGMPRLDALDDQSSRQAGLIAQIGKIQVHGKHDGKFIQDVWSPHGIVVHDITDKGTVANPWSGWVIQRWLTTQAPVDGVNVGGQPLQSTRSWLSRQATTPNTFSITHFDSESGSGTFHVGNNGSDATWGNPCKELLHEILLIEGVLSDIDIQTLQNWATARLTGVNTGAVPVDPNPVDPGAGDHNPPAGWGLDMEDDFNTTFASTTSGLDPNKWKHRNFGNNVNAHGGAARWDGENQLQVRNGAVELKVRMRDGLWRVSGFMQGLTKFGVGAWNYHPGYHQFHVRVRSRWSHAIAPGIGFYTLMWPAHDGWTTEIDIMEMPGRQKNKAQATVHYGMGTSLGHKQNTREISVDLTQWHTWDCRRTYRLINGVPHATIRVWCDGIELTNSSTMWVDNPYMVEPMVFGPAGYVAPSVSAGWYTVPSSETPQDATGFVDFVQIWTPEAGDGGGVPAEPSITLEYPNGNPVAGQTFTFNVATANLSSFEYAVFSGSHVAYTNWQSKTVGAGNVTPVTTGVLQLNDYVQVRTPGANTIVKATPAATEGAGTPPGTTGPVAITIQGQSNAAWLWAWTGASQTRIKDTLAALTGLANDTELRWWSAESASGSTPGTMRSATATYQIPTNANEDWMNPGASGADPANPATWGQHPLMDGAISYITTRRSQISPDRPWLLVRMHNEYDQWRHNTPEETGVYAAANREFIKRLRAAAQRDASLMPVFYWFVPYWFSTTETNHIKAAWNADVNNPGMNATWAIGDESYGGSRDSGSHYNDAAVLLLGGLLSIRLAKWLWLRGYSKNNLDWLPELGPAIASAKHVAGQNNALDITIEHDKGDDLVIPASPQFNLFSVNANGTNRAGTGITKVNATTLRVTFDGDVTGTAGTVTLRYANDGLHHGSTGSVTDNWGSKTKPEYSPSWMGSLNLPIQRLRAPIVVSAA